MNTSRGKACRAGSPFKKAMKKAIPELDLKAVAKGVRDARFGRFVSRLRDWVTSRRGEAKRSAIPLGTLRSRNQIRQDPPAHRRFTADRRQARQGWIYRGELEPGGRRRAR